MSADAFLIDAQIRHQILIQRLSGKTFNDVDEVLQSLRNSIVERLGREPTDFQLHRLRLLLSDIEGIMNEHGAQLNDTLMEEIEDFIEYEVGFQGRTLGNVVNTETNLPAISQVVAAFTSQPTEIVSGNRKITQTIGGLIEQFNAGRKQEISNLIRGGFIEGRTTDEVTREVSRRVEGRTRTQARSLVRTATNHAATVARRETFAANSDVLEGEEWVSVLDLRTTLTCMGLSGQVFDVGSGPYPPQHFNCRSVRVPKVKEEFSLFRSGSERPAVGADGAEQVSTRKTFAGWLRSQPASFQREFFGKFKEGEQRYQLFSQGRIDPKRFIEQDGVVLSLDELRERELMAFERAGIL